jgi:hypothetical protein
MKLAPGTKAPTLREPACLDKKVDSGCKQHGFDCDQSGNGSGAPALRDPMRKG